jgi:hypothetical protein
MNVWRIAAILAWAFPVVVSAQPKLLLGRLLQFCGSLLSSGSAAA